MEYVQPLLDQFFLFSLFDCFEIGLLVAFFYFIFSWLSCHALRILALVYLYIGFVTFALVMDFFAIQIILYTAFPLCVILFVISWQYTLQNALFTPSSLMQRPQKNVQAESISAIIVRALLQSKELNKEIFCFIENNKSLRAFLSSGIALHAKLTSSLLIKLIAASSNSAAVWLKEKNGMIEAFDIDLREYLLSLKVNESKRELAAIEITNISDAVVVGVSIEGHFFVIAQGKMKKDLSAVVACRVAQSMIEQRYKGRNEYERSMHEIGIF